MQRLNPMMDFVFKALFGMEDKVSKGLLIELLNDILNEKEDRIKDIVHSKPPLVIPSIARNLQFKPKIPHIHSGLTEG